jgi:[ribosomal protein S18]-alanine N-acetyltransferase
MIAVIHAATLDDVDRLAALHRACFEDAWDAGAFRQLIDRPGAIARLGHTETATESQAFILVQVAADESEILTLGTALQSRRSGLACALLAAAAEDAHRSGAREIFLEVAEDNRAAIALYRAAGFREVGRRAKYYHRADGTHLDAINLRATLPLSRIASRMG